jgi:DNA modification methylase
MSDIELNYRAPSELKERRRAFRTHPEKQIDRLCASIREYGFNQPVAIDGEDRIVCGSALVMAAKRLGLNRIPVIRLDHLKEGELRAYAIAANKLAEFAGYDEAELSLELADIQALIGSYELPEMGFNTPELDHLLGLDDCSDKNDTVDPPDPLRAISRIGDVWRLRRHLLLCGDALSGQSYSTLMNEERAEFAISDPPYNLRTDMFSTTGRHSDFCQGAGEFDSTQFTRFMTTAMRHMASVSTDGSIHMFFMSHHFLLELLRAGRIVYGDLKTIITWVKPFPTLGSWYRSQTEFIAAFKNGTAPHLNNLGQGRDRSTAWEYEGMAGFGKDRDELLAAHPTPKPVPLIADAILDCSRRGAIILDPFAGSGTILMAAEETGRVARAMELDPLYVDVSIRRFRKATGIEPVLLATGETLADLENRSNEAAGTNQEKNDEEIC